MPAYKESWVFTYPRIPCVVGCGSNTGTLTLDQMMPKSSDKVIALFWTMSTPCNWLWTDQSLWQGNWVLDSSGQLWEAVSGAPFKVSEDGVMKDAVQGSDGLYRVQLFPGSYVILYSTDGVPVREDGFLVFKYETGLGYLP